MIFKTFNSDSDKFTSKIGILGKSFEELGKSINQRKIEIHDLMSTSLVSSEKEAKNQVGGLWSYLFGEKSTGEKPKDLTLFDNFDANSTLESLKKVQADVENGDDTWQEYFATLNDGKKWQVEFVQNNDLSKVSLEQVEKAQEAARKSATAHNKALEQMTLKAKVASIGLKVLATAGNMIAITLITKGIEGIVKGIDHLINKEKYAQEEFEKISQKSTELTNAYKQEQADLDATVEKYKELNEQLTNTTLTTEEYNSIKNELSSLQDDLVSKYGEEASAIDIVNGKYDEQIKKLETLSRQKAQDFINENSSNIKADWDFLNNTKILTNIKSGLIYIGKAEEIRKQINADMNYIREHREEVLEYVKNKGVSNADEYVDNLFNDLSELLQDDSISSEQITQSTQKLLEYAKASVRADSDTQSAYDALIEGIDEYNQALTSGEGIDKAYNNYEKLRNEFENVSTGIIGIDKLYKALEKTVNEPLDISFNLDKNIEAGRETTQRYLDKLQGVTSDQLRSLNYDDLQSVNSLNNYQDAFGYLVKQLDVSEAGVDALIDRLIELGYIINSVDKQNKENILNALGFDKNASSANAAKRNTIANNVYNSLTDEEISLFGDNLDLIPPEAYNWTEAQWRTFINNLKKITSESFSSLDVAEDLKSATDAFSKLGDAENGLYADILAGNTVDSSDISALKDDFGSLDGGKALEDFADVLLQFPGDAEKGQKALDDLVTTYIDESGILDKLNEENKEYISQVLKKIKVENAEEVVESRLNDAVKTNIKAIKEFSTVLSQHVEILRTADPETDKFKNSLETVKTSFQEFMGSVTGDNEFALSISDDFILQNLADLEAASEGSEEALSRLRVEATKDMVSHMKLNVSDAEFNGITNQINSWIDDAAIDTLEVGTYIDDTPLIQGLNNLVDAGKITQEDMNAILAGIGVSPEINYTPAEIKLPKNATGTLAGALVGAAAGLVVQVPNIKYKVTSGGAKAHYSAPSSKSPSGGGGGSGGGGSSDSNNEFNEQIDWIETGIKRYEEAVTRLNKVESNIYNTFGKRNSALHAEVKAINQEIDFQRKAYEGYMAKANSISLSEDYKQKVQNGTIQIEDITDENLAKNIKDYQTWYEKAIACKDTVDDLDISLSELAKTEFDNIQTEFNGIIGLIEGSASLIDEQLTQIEERGYFANKSYYENLINLEKQNLGQLQQKYDRLQKSFKDSVDSGRIKEGSEPWANMKKEIQDVELEISKTDTSIIKLNKDIRNLDWDIFDYSQERISQITQEADFLIDLLDNGKLYDDNGAFNNAGMSATALHGVNYNIHMQQALDYAEEYRSIQKELADNPYNKDLIARREELLRLQQESITSAEAEKEAIKSLVEEGINIHLDGLQETIDKYKESLSTAKDLYDYQKNIAQQTKEIADLEKIMMAYTGDDSEETRKIVQQTQVSLDEARQNLEETQYDRFISDTEKLLDSMYTEYEEVLNARLDNIDLLLADMIDMVNNNSDTIRKAIDELADTVGYSITPSLTTALGKEGTIATMLSTFNEDFGEKMTSVQGALNSIKSFVEKMPRENTENGDNNGNNNGGSNGDSGSGSGGSTGDNSSSGDNSETNNSNSGDTDNSAPSNTQKSATDSGDGVAKVGDAVIFAKGKYHEDSWGNGRSGSQNINGIVYITKISPSSPYPYHISRTSKFGEANLGWVKLDQLKGYAGGTRKANEDFAWTQENGGELICTKDGALLTPVRGSTIFNSDATNRLYNFANDPSKFISGLNTSLPDTGSTADFGRIINNDNTISITLPGVTNYEDFKAKLQKDQRFISFAQEVTLGRMNGNGKLNKNKYI